MGFIVDIFTADKAADAQKQTSRDQIRASEKATQQTLALQKEMFERVWQGTAVQRAAGDAATRLMAQIMGLNLPSAQTPGQGQGPGQGQQPQTLPAPAPAPGNPLGNTLRNGPFGSNVVANGLAAVASINGGKSGAGPIFMRAADDGGQPLVIGENGQTYGGAQPGNALGGGSLTSGQTGQTQTPQPVPQGPALGSGGAAPAFDVTAWLRSTPAYQSNLDAGMRQLNHSLASRGQLFSGDAGREAIRYGSDYNDRIFGDQFNRLAAIAGAGQTALSQGASSGANYANQGTAAFQNNAARLGSSYQNRGDAISGFWGDVNGAFDKAAGNFAKVFTGNPLGSFM